MKPPAQDLHISDAELDLMSEVEARNIGARVHYYWALRNAARIRERAERAEEQALAAWRRGERGVRS